MHARVGSIFVDEHADFFEVVKTSAKTVTVAPIEREAVELLSRWETSFRPMPGRFCGEPFRRTVKNFSSDGRASMERIDVMPFDFAFLYDGEPAVMDAYN